MVAAAPGPPASLTAAATRLGLLTPVLLTVARRLAFCTWAHFGAGWVGCKRENRSGRSGCMLWTTNIATKSQSLQDHKMTASYKNYATFLRLELTSLRVDIKARQSYLTSRLKGGSNRS